MECLQRMLDVNVYHFTVMLKTFLPNLLARKHRTGVIIVSSMNDRIVVPVNITYGAAKVASSYLGCALQQELKHFTNLDMMVVTPSYASTAFNKNEKLPSALTLTGL